MPSTYSQNLRIELIASGEQGNSWGNTTNNNLGTLIEQAISGYVSLATGWSSNAITLTALNGAQDQSRNMYLEIPSSVGLSAQGEITAPTVQKMYVIKNNSSGGFAVRIKTGTSATSCLIPNGQTKIVVCDGTEFSEAVTGAADFYIANAPTTSLQATNKSYVDTADNLRLKRDGTQNMTGELILSSGGTPSNSLAAVSKQYVTATFLPLAGGTLTGSLILPSAAPTQTWQAVPKTYVDAFGINATAPLVATGTAGTGINMSVATATASSLGVVKGGGNVTIAGDGTLSVSGIGAGTVTSVSGSAGSGFVVSTTNPTTTPTVSVAISTGLTTLLKGSAGSLANASASDITTLIGGTTYYPYSANPAGYITSSALSPYATQTFVTSQGYQTSSGSVASATTATFLNGSQSYSFGTPTYNNGTASTVGALFRTAVGGGAAAITAVNSNNNAVNGAALFLVRTNSTNTGNPTGEGSYVSFIYGTGAISGAGIVSVSSGTQINYATGSDYRLKQNIVPVTGALARVAALNPVNFEFKSNPGTKIDGFLAHEVAEVAPNAINGVKDAVDEEGNPIYQGIDQGKLVPLLVAAIKELKAEIDALKGA